jgi:hypothetical protein
MGGRGRGVAAGGWGAEEGRVGGRTNHLVS